MTVRFFKRPWEESRGDEYDSWGTSTWYFEIGDDSYVSRQVEIFENGVVLRYDEAHVEDIYGGLGEGARDLEGEGFLPFEIGQAEFEQVWATVTPLNR